MQLVEGDPLDAQRSEGALAGRSQMLRAAVPLPTASRPGEPALGGHEHRLAIAAPATQGLGDEPLVVADVGVVEAVDIGGVDQSHAGLERRPNHLQGLALGWTVLQREVHAPVADRRDRGRAGTHDPDRH